MSPQRSSLCSLHPRRPKWIMLFSHTVFNRACGVLNPSNFLSKRISISSSVSAVVAFGLFPSQCRFSCFSVRFQRVSCFFWNQCLWRWFCRNWSDSNGVQHWPKFRGEMTVHNLFQSWSLLLKQPGSSSCLIQSEESSLFLSFRGALLLDWF